MTSAKELGLATALREVRLERGWTLADVSSRTGIPPSTLSKVENGRLSLNYDKILRLSQGMEVDITRLFNESPATPGAQQNGAIFSNRRSIDRAGHGHYVQTSSYDHLYLATDLLNKQVDPIVANLRVRTMEEFGDWVRHPGEEFAYVLEGEVELHTEIYAPVLLHPGDSVYFDCSMGHAYLAAGDGPSRVLSICTSGNKPPAGMVKVVAAGESPVPEHNQQQRPAPSRKRSAKAQKQSE